MTPRAALTVAVFPAQQMSMTEIMDNRRKKLLYRATYRGFKEADLLISAFAKEALAGMSDAELDEFEILLDQNDRLLYAWAMGNAETPAEFNGAVMMALQEYAKKPIEN